MWWGGVYICELNSMPYSAILGGKGYFVVYYYIDYEYVAEY